MMLALVLAAMMTPFGEKVTAENAWREYPRPQMVRANWQCLNGAWDWQVTKVDETAAMPSAWQEKKILVPFAIESPHKQIANDAGKGLGGSIYTQTTDVEREVSGLLTYDRRVFKFDKEVLRAAHRKILEAAR